MKGIASLNIKEKCKDCIYFIDIGFDSFIKCSNEEDFNLMFDGNFMHVGLFELENNLCKVKINNEI